MRSRGEGWRRRHGKVVALPLTLTAFLLPLWEIHIYMLGHRQKVEDEYADRASRFEQEIRASLDSEGELQPAVNVYQGIAGMLGRSGE